MQSGAICVTSGCPGTINHAAQQKGQLCKPVEISLMVKPEEVSPGVAAAKERGRHPKAKRKDHRFEHDERAKAAKHPTIVTGVL